MKYSWGFKYRKCYFFFQIHFFSIIQPKIFIRLVQIMRNSMFFIHKIFQKETFFMWPGVDSSFVKDDAPKREVIKFLCWLWFFICFVQWEKCLPKSGGWPFCINKNVSPIREIFVIINSEKKLRAYRVIGEKIPTDRSFIKIILLKV